MNTYQISKFGLSISALYDEKKIIQAKRPKQAIEKYTGRKMENLGNNGNPIYTVEKVVVKDGKVYITTPYSVSFYSYQEQTNDD